MWVNVWARLISRDGILVRFGLKFALCAIVAIITNVMPVPIVSQAMAAEKNLDVSTSRVHRVFVPQSKSLTIKLNRNFGDLLIADGKIADAQPITDQILYVIGRGPGTTSISLFDEDKQSLGVIEVEVGVDVADLSKAINQAVPGARILIGTANGRLRLTGRVKDGVMLAKVLDISRQYGQPNIINAITVEQSQQVNLEVRILEVGRLAGRDLGIALNAQSSGNTDFSAGPIGGNAFAVAGLAGGAPFANMIARVLEAGLNVDLLVKALERKNLARRLAEPNLTTLSGEPASFHAGGEVPIPVQGADGEVTVTFKEFGVKLDFTPTVLENSKINLRLAPEVSEVDVTRSVTTNGISVPGFATRKAETVVELRDGQGFAIAGLLQTQNRKEQSQLPWLGQVPVLGALFRSSSYIKDETDLVIIVTPRLVRPASARQTIKTPFDNKLPANDPQFFLLGKLEVTKDMIRRYRNGDGVEGPYGHMLTFTNKSELAYVKK